MSTAVEEKKSTPSQPLFGKKERQLLSDPLDSNNPITVQVLGICSALAVTVQMKPAFFMTLGVIFVTMMSNLIISIMRNAIPARVRIIVQLAVVSTFVILVDQILKAYAYDVSKQLSVFVGLIVTNCIVMGRLEAFAMGNKPFPSLIDGIGNGLGYGAILMVVAFIRELLGSGSVFGFKVFDALGINYIGNGVMVIPAGASIVIGIVIWAQRARNGMVESE
ncbi:MAG: NADH:ubiquinone reductase (Na(+)-transporting) subunit D [Bacteroidota bacterium]|nr:NADH:ubiquinone reductase (Na(+)-transporting) subunit D [Bacteroidota bacterium]MDX5431085.1 NADH:ubiquinone reductase (Na(+)-transporting) subunit D [Bacteroidota bacterium]MDX5469839.1 NADH:ubiquinone reductase (Na(+)-transporting) subunit D [Bacteroidota bacterium]